MFKQFKGRYRLIFVLFVILVIVLASAACSPKQEGQRRVILPGAYQFCLDHPDHEECVP